MRENLDIGGVLSRVFSTYGSQLGVLLPGALIVFLPIAIINGLILGAGGNLVLLVITGLISVVGTYFFMGMVVQLVRDIQDGRRDSTLGQLFQSVTPVIVPLILAAILAGIGIIIGFILLIIPGLFLLTIWAVVAPVIVVERASIGDAFGRSRELVRGNGWQVLAVLVVFFLINAIGSQIISGIITGIAASVAGVIIAQLVTQVLITPLIALASPTIYFDLVGLKEGAAPAAGAGAAAPAGTAPPPPPAPTGGTTPQAPPSGGSAPPPPPPPAAGS